MGYLASLSTENTKESVSCLKSSKYSDIQLALVNPPKVCPFVVCMTVSVAPLLSQRLLIFDILNPSTLPEYRRKTF